MSHLRPIYFLYFYASLCSAARKTDAFVSRANGNPCTKRCNDYASTFFDHYRKAASSQFWKLPFSIMLFCEFYDSTSHRTHSLSLVPVAGEVVLIHISVDTDFACEGVSDDFHAGLIVRVRHSASPCINCSVENATILSVLMPARSTSAGIASTAAELNPRNALGQLGTRSRRDIQLSN